MINNVGTNVLDILKYKNVLITQTSLKNIEGRLLNEKINYLDLIKMPVITEKATILSDQNKTVFKVDNSANKKIIKKNIEKIYKVKVLKINILKVKSKEKVIRGKKSSKTGYKKAIVTLKKGQSIDLTSGI